MAQAQPETTEVQMCNNCRTPCEELLRDNPPLRPDLCPVCRIRPLDDYEVSKFDQ